MAKRTPATPAKGEAMTPVSAAIVVPGVTDDAALVAQGGKAVVEFLKGLTAFFKTAQGLEQSALSTLATARTWKEPTNGEEDVALQMSIKAANTDKKVILEHWKITSLVSQFHKRLTARRDRGANALEESAEIGNRLHNGYTTKERERVRRLEEQERQQAELDAQAARDRELMEIERKALEAEEQSPSLSAREQLFVDAYTAPGGVAAGNAAKCAKLVGYKDPDQVAVRLMKASKIVAAVEAVATAAALRAQKQARAAAPLEVAATAPIRPDIQKAAGAHDRTTFTIEFTDTAKFREAAFSGQYGIPHDIFEPAQAKGNEYARSMRELVNRWPGCRLVKDTGVV